MTDYFKYKSRDMVTRFIRDGYIMKHSIMGTLYHALNTRYPICLLPEQRKCGLISLPGSSMHNQQPSPYYSVCHGIRLLSLQQCSPIVTRLNLKKYQEVSRFAMLNYFSVDGMDAAATVLIDNLLNIVLYCVSGPF